MGNGDKTPLRLQFNPKVRLEFPVVEGVAGKPGCRTPGRKPYFRYSSQG